MHPSSTLSVLRRLTLSNRIVSFAVLPLFTSAITAQVTFINHYSDLIEVEDNVTYSSGQAFDFSSFLFESGFANPIPKFDPSLGTLLEVNITFFIEANVQVELQGSTILDANEPHGASFDIFSNPLTVGLFYTPTPEDFITDFSSVDADFSLSFEREDSTTDSESLTSDAFTFDLNDTVVVYNPDNGIFADNLNDFVGVGTIVGLRPGMFVPTTGTFTLNNIGDAVAYTDAAVYGWIEVEYVYQIPEVAHFGVVVALAALGLAVYRRRRLTR